MPLTLAAARRCRLKVAASVLPHLAEAVDLKQTHRRALAWALLN